MNTSSWLLMIVQSVLLTLKLTEYISWSWWIILSPIIYFFVVNVVFMAGLVYGAKNAKPKDELPKTAWAKKLEELRNRGN